MEAKNLLEYRMDRAEEAISQTAQAVIEMKEFMIAFKSQGRLVAWVFAVVFGIVQPVVATFLIMMLKSS
jgi:hypothetical protein